MRVPQPCLVLLIESFNRPPISPLNSSCTINLMNFNLSLDLLCKVFYYLSPFSSLQAEIASYALFLDPVILYLFFFFFGKRVPLLWSFFYFIGCLQPVPLPNPISERKNHSILISESLEFSSKPDTNRYLINICLTKCLS